MKKIIMMFSLLVCLCTIALAQGQRQMGTPEQRAQRNIDALDAKFKFTAEQKEKISSILLTQAKAIDSLRASVGEGSDRQLLRTKMVAITESSDQKVSALLTDDQKKVYDVWKQERKSRMNGGQRPAVPKE